MEVVPGRRMSEDEPIKESKSDERFRLVCTSDQVTTNGTKKDRSTGVCKFPPASKGKGF